MRGIHLVAGQTHHGGAARRRHDQLLGPLDEKPTPYVNFMPPEFALFNSSRIANDFRRAPPDVVLIVHKDAGGLQLRWFGRDYARDLWGWVEAHYRRVASFGDPPLRPGSRFGIDVLVHEADADLPRTGDR